MFYKAQPYKDVRFESLGKSKKSIVKTVKKFTAFTENVFDVILPSSIQIISHKFLLLYIVLFENQVSRKLRFLWTLLLRGLHFPYARKLAVGQSYRDASNKNQIINPNIRASSQLVSLFGFCSTLGFQKLSLT